MLTCPAAKQLNIDKRQENKSQSIGLSYFSRLHGSNSRRLLTLINQLLELSKLDSGKMTLQAFRQDAVPFLKGAAGAFDSLAKERNIDLVFQAKEKEISLCFDPEKLEKIISNLIANAIKFTPAEPLIAPTATVLERRAPRRGEPISRCAAGVTEGKSPRATILERRVTFPDGASGREIRAAGFPGRAMEGKSPIATILGVGFRIRLHE